MEHIATAVANNAQHGAEIITPGTIGFYAPDPGHLGKSPNVVLSVTGNTVTVREIGHDLVMTFDNADWMGLPAMRNRVLDVANGPRYNNGGPMSDMRNQLLEGYVDALCKAVELAQPPQKAPDPNPHGLTLFTVTLPWNLNDAEEGDYCSNVWASDHDAAVRLLAEEMADLPDSGIDENDEAGRQEFIEGIVSTASPYAAESVTSNIASNLSSLLAGPSGEMSDQAKADLQSIQVILSRHGISS